MHDDITFTQKLSLFILVLIFFYLPLYLTAATPEAIAKCQEATGWTAERCEFEINR